MEEQTNKQTNRKTNKHLQRIRFVVSSFLSDETDTVVDKSRLSVLNFHVFLYYVNEKY